MLDSKQIIEEIRKIRFGIGLDTTNLINEQKAALRDKEEILKDASKLAKEIHTKNPHFIFELIQNAEDNEYEHPIPAIKFIIDSDYLIIQNNEKGFEAENVRKLCGIGGSTKSKAMGYIGEKGIGFKSVFMVANKVQIYSNGFQFSFNYNEYNPVTMIIPEWINETPDFIDPKQTNIVLYLKPEIKNKITNYFDEIHPSILLFLRKLKVIETQEKDKDIVRKMEINKKDGISEIVYNEKRSYWKVINKEELKVPQGIDEERRKDVNETEIILAFPLKEDYSPDTSNEQSVFAFLPVRDYGFKFIIQADFILPITREDIIKDNKWNEWLRDCIADVFLSAVNDFKNDINLKYSFYDYFPLEEVKEEFFLPLVAQIYEKLKDENCILTESNKWKKPCEVLIGDEEIKKIVTNEDLQGFFKKEYLSEKVKGKKAIFQKLGIKDFSVDDLIQCLENTEWIKKQNETWFAHLFSYLNKKNLSNKQLEQLKCSKIIKLENGELTSTSEGVVFFPLEKKEVYGFENEIRVIEKGIIEIEEEKNSILEFLKKLGLKQADAYEIIENHILPVYENKEWKQKDSKVLTGYVRYIKDNIDRYAEKSDKKLNSDKASWKSKEDPLKRLKDSLFIRINKDDEEKEWYSHPEGTYLPKIYGNENNLEELFENINVSFVHPCYIEDLEKDKEIKELENKLNGESKRWKKKNKKEVKKIEERITKLKDERNKRVAEWKEFFLKIGVNDAQKVEYYKGQVSSNDKYPTYEEREYSTCGHNVIDWRLSKEFGELLKKTEINKIKILLSILDKYWKDKYSNYLEMDYQWFYYQEHHKKLPSSFIRELRENIRIPTTQNTLAKPSEVFLNKPEIHEVIGDIAPYLAVKIKYEDFISNLGINTQANIDGVLNYLKSLIDQKSNDKEKFERIYKFLDDHFEKYSNKIKEKFEQTPLIFIPNSEKNYYSIREVIWKDISDIFGRNRVYLEKYYPNLRKFFVEKLGISEKPTPKDYADVLVTISRKKEKVSDEDKDIDIIKKIYEELNRNLNPDKVDDIISKEDWWRDFTKKPVFLTDKNEFWSNNENIFINDNNAFYKIFKNEEGIAFLWLPDGYYPKISTFIDACGFCYLSKQVKIELSSEGMMQPEKDEKYTNLVKNVLWYVLRYLYYKEYREYERLKENRMPEEIGAVEVYAVEYLKVKYSIYINEWKKIEKLDERNCIYDGNNLYLKKNGGGIIDLAIEFSKLFGEIKGFDDFLMNIMNDSSRADDIMRVKGIDDLPRFELNFWSKFINYTELPPDKTKTMRESGLGNRPTEEEQQESVQKQRLIETYTYTSSEKQWRPDVAPQYAKIKIEIYTPPPRSNNTSSECQWNNGSSKSANGSDSSGRFENVSSDINKDIGKWGEEYAFIAIKEEIKEKYPDATIEVGECYFKLIKDGDVITEVKWLNCEEESKKHYDILIKENGVESFVEVKSTTGDEKTWFSVSKNQWGLMKEKGDNFYIYRVYNAGTKDVKVVKIPNPAELWKEGRIDADPIRIII